MREKEIFNRKHLQKYWFSSMCNMSCIWAHNQTSRWVTKLVAILACATIVVGGLAYTPGPKAHAVPPINIPEYLYFPIFERIPESGGLNRIFREGSKLPIPELGFRDLNLINHLFHVNTKNARDVLTRRTTSYQTVYDSAESIIQKAPAKQTFSIYKFKPTKDTFNVEQSLEHKINYLLEEELPEISLEMIMELHDAADKSKWVVQGNIAPEQIHGLLGNYRTGNEDGFVIQQTFNGENNLNYRPSPEGATGNPLNLDFIDASQACIYTPITIATFDSPLPASGECRFSLQKPVSEGELFEIHHNNWILEDGVAEFGSTDFVLNEMFVDGVQGRMLSPLQESREILTDFEITGTEGMEVLESRLGSALENDLNKVEVLLSDKEFAAKVSQSEIFSDSSVGVAEFSPLAFSMSLAAIAMTGYGMYADYQAGNWANLAFDSVAEALLILDLIPGMQTITVPLLALEVIAKAVYDYYRAEYERSLMIHDWDQNQTNHDMGLWNELPQFFVDYASDVSRNILIEATDFLRQNDLMVPTKQALEADLLLLSRLERSYISGVNARTNMTLRDVEPDDSHAIATVEASQQRMINAVNEEFSRFREQTLTRYAETLQLQSQAMFTMLTDGWQPSQQNTQSNQLETSLSENSVTFNEGVQDFGFDHVFNEFDENMVKKHINNLEDLMWQHHQFGSNTNGLYDCVPALGVEGCRKQVREHQYQKYVVLREQSLQDSLHQTILPNWFESNIALLSPNFNNKTLSLEGFNVLNSSSSSLNIADVLQIGFVEGGFDGFVSQNVLNEKLLNQVFNNAGRININMYSEEHRFLFGFDSWETRTRDDFNAAWFFSQLGFIPENAFVEFVFENPVSSVGLSVGGASSINNVSRYVVQNVNNSFVAWVPSSLDLFALEAVDNLNHSSVNIAGGTFLTLIPQNGGVMLLEATSFDPSTGEPLGDWREFVDIGIATINVYNTRKEFVASFDSANSGVRELDLSHPEMRDRFYGQVENIEDGWFLEFTFDNPISFIGLGSAQNVYGQETKRFIVERVGETFVGYVNENLVEDQTLTAYINETLKNKHDQPNRKTDTPITQTDLEKLVSLEITGQMLLRDRREPVMSLNGLEYAKNIKKILISDSKIPDIPARFDNLKQLNHLDLSNNQISRLHQEFGDISGLEFVNLSHNNLTEIPDSFGNLFKLSNLKLDSNHVLDFSAINANIQSFSAINQTYTDTSASSMMVSTFTGSYALLSLVETPNVLDTNRHPVTPDPDSLEYLYGITWFKFVQCVVSAVNVERTQHLCYLNNGHNDRNISAFRYSLKPANNISGTASSNTILFHEPTPDPDYVFLGYASVNRNISTLLPGATNQIVSHNVTNGIVNHPGIPEGLKLVLTDSGLNIEGKPTKPYKGSFKVTTTTGIGNVELEYGLEVLSHELIVVSPGQMLDPVYNEDYYYTYGIGVKILFAEKSSGILPSGIKFNSSNVSICPKPHTFNDCEGTVKTVFSGLVAPNEAEGRYEVKVDKRLKEYIIFGQWINKTLETKTHSFLVTRHNLNQPNN